MICEERCPVDLLDAAAAAQGYRTCDARRSESLAGARVGLGQRILRGDDVLIEAKVEAAIVNEAGRPRRLPKAWAAFLAPYGASASHRTPES